MGGIDNDDLHWRNILTDDFDWPGAGTDDDPGASMDITRKYLRTSEPSRNYQPAEYALPRPPPPPPEHDYSEEDYLHIEEGGTLEEALAQIEFLQQQLLSLYLIQNFLNNNSYDEMPVVTDARKGLGLSKERFCIGPGGKVVSWMELSSGYSWIGVSANDTCCLVTMADPICKLPPDKTQLSPYTVLKGALADMIGDTPNSFRKIEGFHPGNFAIISVASCAPDQELEIRSLEKKRHRVFRFLQEKLENCSTLSYEETEQISVCALKLLLERSFNPYKTEVCGWGKLNPWSGDCFRMSAKRVREALTSMV